MILIHEECLIHYTCSIMIRNEKFTLTQNALEHTLTRAITTIPITGRIVARLVTIAVFNPGARAALGTVWHRPCQINLRRNETENKTISGFRHFLLST